MTSTTGSPEDGYGSFFGAFNTFANVLGCNANGNGQLAASVFGSYSSVTGAGGTVFGFNGTAAQWASAVGLDTVASGKASTALGFGSNATGPNAVAIGGAGGNGTTPLSPANSTTASGAGSIAIGSNATAGAQATNTNAMAIGGQSSAAEVNSIALGAAASATAISAVSLGANSQANNANDVALGAGSITTTPDTGTTALYGGAAAGTATSVVSVGAAGSERQITNVAPGVIGSTSTDAINGSQLFSVAQGINRLGAAMASALGGGAMYNASTGVLATPSFTIQGGTYGNVGAALFGLDAAVTTAQNTANQALAIANNSVQYDPSRAGTGGSTGTGVGGGTSVTLNPGGASAGVHNLAPGAVSPTSTDAVNGSQLYAVASQAAGMFRVSADANTTAPAATGTQSVAGGNGAVASGANSTAVGDGSSATGSNSTALGNGAQAMGANSVAIGAGSVASTANSVSVGSAGNTRKVTNVSAGTVATDAANVGQLQAAANQAITAANTYTDASSKAAVASANTYTNQQVQGISDQFNQRISNLGRQVDANCAMGAAMNQMAMAGAGAQEGGRIAAGVGMCSGGSGALSVGYATPIGERAHLNFGAAFANGQGQVGAGIGWDLK